MTEFGKGNGERLEIHVVYNLFQRSAENPMVR